MSNHSGLSDSLGPHSTPWRRRKEVLHTPRHPLRVYARGPLGSVVGALATTPGGGSHVRRRTSGSAVLLRPLSGPGASKAVLGHPSTPQNWRELSLQRGREEPARPWVGQRSQNPETPPGGGDSSARSRPRVCCVSPGLRLSSCGWDWAWPEDG